MIEGLGRIVSEHPFFAGLGEEFKELIAGCAANVRCEAGEYVFREHEPADHFFLIREGKVELEFREEDQPTLIFQTLGEGEIFGESWLTAPYEFHFDARAVDRTRLISIDAECLRNKCEENNDLGWDLMKRFVPVLNSRLQAARLQVMDVYRAS